MTQIVTGDAVILDLRPARIPTRMLATAIDLALIAGVSFLFDYIVTQVGGSSSRQQAISIAAAIVVMFGYPIGCETVTRGRTLGAWTLGLRVVRDDGGGIRFRQALLRGLAFWTLDFAPWTGFCGGLVCAAVNRDSKRFGDLMAGTLVIRTRAPRAARPLPPMPPELELWASQLELSRLPDALVTAARTFVQRYDGLLAYPQQQLALDLARQVAQLTAPAPPAGLEPRDFLTAVVVERRRRETSKLAARHSVPTAEQLPAGWR
ncbi:MAG: RDD family protein [Propionibacteriaceae bacterium]